MKGLIAIITIITILSSCESVNRKKNNFNYLTNTTENLNNLTESLYAFYYFQNEDNPKDSIASHNYQIAKSVRTKTASLIIFCRNDELLNDKIAHITEYKNFLTGEVLTSEFEALIEFLNYQFDYEDLLNEKASVNSNERLELDIKLVEYFILQSLIERRNAS